MLQIPLKSSSKRTRLSRLNRNKTWGRVFHNKIYDNCQTFRKQDNDNKTDIILPSSEFKLISGREKITETYSSLFYSFMDESNSNMWINDAMNKIIENGNQHQMVQNIEADAIGKDVKNGNRSLVSPQIMIREFISRQYNGIGTRPEKVQATFSVSSAMVLAPNIVSTSEWREFGPEICNELGWSFKSTLAFRYVLCEAARRMGKTRFISMTAVNFALSRPGSTVIVFSTSQDASNLLRQDVDNMLNEAGDVEFAGKMFTISKLTGRHGQRMLELYSPYNMVKASKIYFNSGIMKHNMDKKVCSKMYFFIFFFYFSSQKKKKRYVIFFFILKI